MKTTTYMNRVYNWTWNKFNDYDDNENIIDSRDLFRVSGMTADGEIMSSPWSNSKHDAAKWLHDKCSQKLFVNQ